MATTTEFREVQTFRQPWLLAVLAATAAPMWLIAAQQLILREPVGERPAPDSAVFLLWAVFGVGFPLFFSYLGLITEVRGDELRLRFRPLPARRIPWSSISSAEAITYRPLRDFGGWGIRYGRGGRRAYNVSGNRGVELTLTDGKRIVIGSRRPDELQAAIATVRARPR